MTDSQQLLAEYARNGSDAAFGELVTRYVDLVYSTALRLVEARAVAVSLGVAEVGQHFAHGKPAGRGLPAPVFGGEFGHQPAQNGGRRFQQIEAGQAVVLHGFHPTMFSPPSTWMVLPVIQ